MKSSEKKTTRWEFIKSISRKFLLFVLGGFVFSRLFKTFNSSNVWQIDPTKCVKCGRCATECVLNPSAVKCVHEYEACGYCNLCFAYFQPGAALLTENAENEVCPTNALKRKFVEEPFFEYSIDEPLCIGCAKCVKGCTLFGNSSLFLQIKHDRCKNCNECAIARVCAGNAFERVSLKNAYFKRT